MITMHIHPRTSTADTEPALRDVAASVNRPGALPGPAEDFILQGRGAGVKLVGAVHTGVEALGLTLALVRRGAWDVVVDLVGDESAGESALGPALDRAHRSTGCCAVAGLEAGSIAWVESALQLLGALEGRRSEPQQQAGRLVEAGASQREVATELGVSQQAVHARLRGGLWHETRALAGAVAAALEEQSRRQE